ncbi:MAG TPA: hypothetical protein VHG10_04490 [Glycomyces sp.]|nr:hypothetical protein [Glycomyces sp.]
MERRESSATAAGIRWAAALAAMGLALTGCGAGNNAQTTETEAAISGVNVDAGTLALRDLQVDFGEEGFYPEGGQAPLRVWIGNEGDEPVFLEAVTSPMAETVTLATELIVVEETPDGDATESPEGESPTVEESPGSDGASPTADAEETESPEGETESPQETESPEGETESPDDTETVDELVGEPEFEVEIEPASYVRLTPASGSFLLLEGLKEDVTLESTVEVVFTFSNGEEVMVPLPMGLPAESPSRSYFEAEGEEHAE